MTKIQIVAASSLFALLYACAQTPVKPESTSSSAPSGDQAEYVVKHSITQQQRFREILNLLERGIPDAASAELDVYLQAQPDSAIGKSLRL